MGLDEYLDTLYKKLKPFESPERPLPRTALVTLDISDVHYLRTQLESNPTTPETTQPNRARYTTRQSKSRYQNDMGTYLKDNGIELEDPLSVHPNLLEALANWLNGTPATTLKAKPDYRKDIRERVSQVGELTLKYVDGLADETLVSLHLAITDPPNVNTRRPTRDRCTSVKMYKAYMRLYLEKYGINIGKSNKSQQRLEALADMVEAAQPKK